MTRRFFALVPVVLSLLCLGPLLPSMPAAADPIGSVQLVSGWQMVSFPILATTPLGSFDVIDETTGERRAFAQAANDWVMDPMFAYVPALKRYQTVRLGPTAETHDVDAHHGYWVYSFAANPLQMVPQENGVADVFARLDAVEARLAALEATPPPAQPYVLSGSEYYCRPVPPPPYTGSCAGSDYIFGCKLEFDLDSTSLLVQFDPLQALQLDGAHQPMAPAALVAAGHHVVEHVQGCSQTECPAFDCGQDPISIFVIPSTSSPSTPNPIAELAARVDALEARATQTDDDVAALTDRVAALEAQPEPQLLQTTAVTYVGPDPGGSGYYDIWSVQLDFECVAASHVLVLATATQSVVPPPVYADGQPISRTAWGVTLIPAPDPDGGALYEVTGLGPGNHTVEVRSINLIGYQPEMRLMALVVASPAP